jgi:hypothetical protein
VDFAIYKKESGLIVRKCSCPCDHVDIQCEADEEFYLNCPAGSTHIEGGLPVKKEAVPPEVTTEQKVLNLRTQRNNLLNQADLVYCNPERWSSMTPEKQAEWSTYKQALRDLPTTDLDNIKWPEIPKGD